MDLDRFVQLRPFAYHTTTCLNFLEIQKRRELTSAESLLAGTRHEHLLHSQRGKCHKVEIGDAVVEIRDQKPIREGSVRFEDGWTLATLLKELNQRVFFWPGTTKKPVVRGVRHFDRYVKTGDAVVIRAPMRSLLDANPGRVASFSRVNTGSARHNKGKPVVRGAATFLSSKKVSYRPSQVVELSFVDSATLPVDSVYSYSMRGVWFDLAEPLSLQHRNRLSVEAFVRQVRSRSAENARAVTVLYRDRLLSNVVGVLRQEVDSMVRLIYLLSINDRARRHELIASSVAGDMWRTPAGGKVTDREMVELANRLSGWTRSVYKFGCAFIHLSRNHDYSTRDPFLALPAAEQMSILGHLRYYHGGPPSHRPTFDDLAPYLPRVFSKINSNLESYLVSLERDGDIHAP